MAFTRIILWLGNAFVLCAAMMLLTSIVGLTLGEMRETFIFVFLALVSGLLGGVLVFSTANTQHEESTTDALIFLLLFWLFMPIALAFPYWLEGSVSSLMRGYFEAVSAFTTTGATTLVPEQLPQVMLFWQSLLQWVGGVIASTFAVVILAALNLSGTGVHRSKLFTLKRGQLFPRLLAIGRIVALIYAVIAALCFIGLALSGAPLFDSLCLSLSAISTGGLTPRSGPLAAYISDFGALIIALACVFGAANVAVLWDVIRLKNFRSGLRFFKNIEHRGLLMVISFLLILGFFYGGVANLFATLVEAVYMATTTGFDFEVIAIDLLPPGVLLGLALIGGSAISTAGGVKIIRLLLLLRHASTDIDRMSHPSRVKLVHFRGQILPDKEFLSIWMYFLGYTLVFGGGTIALGFVGVNYVHSVGLTVSALSNMGPLLDATFPEASYGALDGDALAILSVIMLMGRMEVLAALAAFSPSLWRR